MLRILEKIEIVRTSVVQKKTFINNELSISAKTNFICCNCNTENEIEIIL
jgi:hypothetical protein